jgi:hypothetical protein
MILPRLSLIKALLAVTDNTLEPEAMSGRPALLAGGVTALLEERSRPDLSAVLYSFLTHRLGLDRFCCNAGDAVGHQLRHMVAALRPPAVADDLRPSGRL